MHGTNKRQSRTAYEVCMQCRASCPYSPTDQEGQEWLSHEPHAPTHTRLRKKDENEPGVFGAGKREFTGTKIGTATTHIHVAQDWKEDNVWSPVTTMHTTRTSSKRICAPIEETMMESNPLGYMPRRKRLKSGNGPDTDGRDSPMQWTGHRSDENGAAGSAIAVETDQCVGGGTGYERTNDSRLNFHSRYGPRPSTGGDDTFLTPYSTSTMTDSAVKSLPTLFLAYCALNSADQAWPVV